VGKRSRQRRSRAEERVRPAPAARDRMARVRVDDETWREFRAIAGYRSIAEVLGQLVEREVRTVRSSRLRDEQLVDRELLEALERARNQAEDLRAIVARLESLREA
jgi:hypothetical protein